MIKKGLIELLYDAANIQRWNDHMRPHTGFTELDKQAHKMVFAYVLGKMEESVKQVEINWKGLIEGGIFEFLHRVKLTDIKPPIFHRLMEKKSEELNQWVLKEVREYIEVLDENFATSFERYLLNPKYHYLEKRILKAAHYLATNWEFEIIYHLNSTIYGVKQTKNYISNQFEEHHDLVGVQKILLKKKTHAFLDLVGQLRFQRRWAQTPRIPETSVLGHMLIVAMLSYFCSLQLKACDKRVYNNFFAGLFHDLPEVLTRDIISPVKSSVPGIDSIIKDIEKRQLEERILPLLPTAWHKEINYLINDEFKSKVVLNSESTGPDFVDSCKINKQYNKDTYNPLDGELIKACDMLAAYVEASLSIAFGITSPHLTSAQNSMFEKHKYKSVGGLNFMPLFEYFQ